MKMGVFWERNNMNKKWSVSSGDTGRFKMYVCNYRFILHPQIDLLIQAGKQITG